MESKETETVKSEEALAVQVEEPATKPTQKTKKKPGKKAIIIMAAALVLLIVVSWLWIVPAVSYSAGVKAQENGDFGKAVKAFRLAREYKDANKRAGETGRAYAYTLGEEAFTEGDYAAAAEYFAQAEDYKDAKSRKKTAELGVSFAEGAALLEEGKYEEAAAKFTLAGKFPQADAMRREAYEKLGEQLLGQGETAKAGKAFAEAGNSAQTLSCARTLMEGRQFAEAHALLDSLEDASLEQYQLCAAGLAAFAEGNYEEAVGALEQVTELPEAQNMLPEVYYAQGSAMMDEGSYLNAKTAFEKAGDFSDAPELFTRASFMQAEQYYQDGYLNHAKAAYESLPGDYSYQGVSVSDRLAKLNQYKSFLAICGKWRASSSNNRIETRRTYTSGRYYYWYQEPGSSTGSITVTCKIQDNGTVLVQGQAEFKRYTNYDDNSSRLKTDTKTVSFSKSSATLPKNYDSGSLKLSWTGKVFKLKYQTKDTSKSYATYTYTSEYQYDYRVEAY